MEKTAPLKPREHWVLALRKALVAEGSEELADAIKRKLLTREQVQEMARKRGLATATPKVKVKYRKTGRPKGRPKGSGVSICRTDHTLHGKIMKAAFEKGCKRLNISPEIASRPHVLGLTKAEIKAVGVMDGPEAKAVARRIHEGELGGLNLMWSEQLGALTKEAKVAWRRKGSDTVAICRLSEALSAEFVGYCTLTNQSKHSAMTTLVATALAAFRDGRWGGTVPGTAYALVESRMVELLQKAIRLETGKALSTAIPKKLMNLAGTRHGLGGSAKKLKQIAEEEAMAKGQ